MKVKKKNVLSIMFQKNYKPLTLEGLLKALKITDDEEIKELYHILEAMEKEGSLFKTLQGRYSPLRGMGMIVGELQGHAQGYAFLLPDTPGEKDVFIPPEKMGGAMHRDRVIVRLTKDSEDGRRRQGEVARILTRGNTSIVGTYLGNRRRGVVIPDDRRLFQEIQVTRGSPAAKPGDKLVVTITRWPDSANKIPECKIVEVIGSTGEPGVDITSIQKKYGLPSSFPEKVLKELQNLDRNQIPQDLSHEKREDLRSLPMVTIDGADAKDLDDAVSLQRNGSGYSLGVHIADVGYYVKEGSALDREAAKRATSVYLPDRVIPMFPPLLSNDICSLNPGALRLAMSVIMEIREDGKLESYRFFPSLISVDKRMTYDAVNGILEGDQNLKEEYTDFVQTFLDMAELADVLKEKRLKRGALDFNFPEAKITLDEQGRPIEIKVRRGGRSESIIEEFMLICNEVVATHFDRAKVPFVYRVHERPDEEKLYALRDFLTIFDIKLKGDLSKITPGYFHKVMADVKGTPVEKIINHVLLRSLPVARYSESSLGHFGLAAPFYTHFTSPIRRYPDLLVHRILRSSLNDTLTKTESRRLANKLPQLVQHCSTQERVSMEAERECLDLKKVEFMEGKEGSEFAGTISGVTSFGFFVELDNTVEGLVHVTRMTDDYYIFDEKRYSLVGERTRKAYRLGDSVKVRLDKIDKEARTIHFTALPDENAGTHH
ncbi:MAG: ribonuclease R [Bacillota bacterium]|nr:ribonuclease R [Bacillota bacterium]